MPGASIAWNLFDGLPASYRPMYDHEAISAAFHHQSFAGWGGRYLPGVNGLGIDQTQGLSVVKSANEIGGAVVGGAAAIGSAWATAAIPIVGPAVAAVTIAIMLIMSRKGPKQKTATTTIVNDIEPQLDANVQGYLNGPRTPESQAQAEENFKAGWQAVLDNCGDPSMGNPGKNCISERQEGAHPQWDACKNEPGGCPNWFQLYLYPIQQNPPLVSSSGQPLASTVDAAGNVVPAAGGGSQQVIPGVDNTLLYLGAAALVAALVL